MVDTAIIHTDKNSLGLMYTVGWPGVRATREITFHERNKLPHGRTPALSYQSRIPKQNETAPWDKSGSITNVAKQR